MAQDHQPNIVVFWGDDIGISNLSCYSDGLMGYRTPNIDRLASEGMRFTDAYGEQSCTAGRSAFITGQSVYRTGLSKVGLPGAEQGMQRGGSDDRGAPQAARVRDRPVREEPSRRPRRASADRARLRRVLRESLPPECRGGAGASGLPRPRPLSELPRALRPTGRSPLQGDEERQAEDRGHGAADEEADGDDRRRDRRRRGRLHQAQARRG